MKTIEGRFFSYDGVTIEFFGAKGRLHGKETWAINRPTEGATDNFFEISHEPVMPVVLDCLKQDRQARQLDKVAQVQFSRREAVCFFLEGALTPEHLQGAVEGADYVDFPEVLVASHRVTVRVFSCLEDGIATADAAGVIL